MNAFDELEKYLDQTAFITDTNQTYSYFDLLRAADKLGTKIPKRSLVFSLCENSFDSVAGYVGLMRAGAVPVLLGSGMQKKLLDHLLELYRPEYIYASGQLTKTHYKKDYHLHKDLALLLTTSGSTGSPKFVRLSEQNIFSNAKSIAQYLNISPADRTITTMPMNYSYGLSVLNSYLISGASIVLTNASLMEGNFWNLLKTHRVSNLNGVPYIYEMLKRLRFEKMEFPDLKCLTQAGGRLSTPLAAEFLSFSEKKNIRFFMMYGQTEATARMSYLPPEKAFEKLGSIGLPIPGGEFFLRSESGEKIEQPHQSGELIYSGPNVSMGYAEGRMDLEKADEFKGQLATGDLAERDAEGFYYITGRKNRFLKLFGLRINLAELEALLHEAGFECVCGGTDVALKIYTTQIENRAEIENFLTDATGLHPSGFRFIGVDEIPRSESGKILYSALESFEGQTVNV